MWAHCEDACYEDALDFFDGGGNVFENGNPLNRSSDAVESLRSLATASSKCKEVPKGASLNTTRAS